MGVYQFGELGEDLYHLVGALSTGGDDHDIGFRLFRDGMLQHRLAGTESSRNETGTPLHDRIERVNGADTRLQQLVGAWFLSVGGEGYLHRPALHHGDCMFLAGLIGHHCNGFVDVIGAFLHDALESVFLFHHERNHDLVWLEVFIHLSQPRSAGHLVAGNCQGHERPLFLLVEWESILTTSQEDTLHLVEVVLQPVKVSFQQPRSEHHLQHVSLKLHLAVHPQSTGALEHLHIDILSHHLDHFRHEAGAVEINVGDLVLGNRSIHFDDDQVGNDSFYCSFC